ncbi:MAG: DUF3488 and transglutaminase-like domain-containing protein [Pseudomonadota bacterium]
MPAFALLLLGTLLNALHWPAVAIGVAMASAPVTLIAGRIRWLGPAIGAVLASALLAVEPWQSGDTLTALMAIVSWLKLAEARRAADLVWVLLGGLWLVALGCLWTPTGAKAGMLVGSVVLLVWALARLEGRVALPGALRALGLAVPMAAILFVFTPRITGDLGVLAFALGLPLVIETEVEKNREPMDNALTLGETAGRANTDARVLSATFYRGSGKFYDGVPPLGDLYWRGPVFWTYENGTWQGRKGWESRNTRMKGRIRMRALPGHLREQGRLAFYDVSLFPHRSHWLYALEFPAAVPPSSFVSRDWQLQNLNPVREVLHYPMMSWVDYKAGTTLDPEDRALALALPAEAEPRARALAGELAAAGDPLVIARAGIAHFETGYRYDKDIRDRGGKNPVDRFLFDEKRGFAGHFASAYVVLMRAAGIPARLVAGYRGGVHLGLTNRVFVMEKDAYVWSEIWLDSHGWVRVDAARTLSQPDANEAEIDGFGLFDGVEEDDRPEDPLPEASDEAPLVRVELDRGTQVRTGPAEASDSPSLTAWLLDFDAARQVALLRAVALRPNWQGLVVLAVVALAALGGLALVFAAARRWLAHRALSPERRLQSRIERRLRRHGLRRHPAEGLRSFFSRAAWALPDAEREELLQIGPALRQAIYGKDVRALDAT